MCRAYRCLPSQLDGEIIERCLDQQSLLSYAQTHAAMKLPEGEGQPTEGPDVDLYYEVKVKLREMQVAGEVR